MTWNKWLIVVLCGFVGIGMGVFLLRQTVPLSGTDSAAGLSVWDGACLVAGVALGTLLRLTLNWQAPTTPQIVAGFVGLVFLGALTYLPWLGSSPVRTFVLPVMELLIAAWITTGTNRST
jgi:hypothetical protein